MQSTMQYINIIAAVSNNNVIGRNGDLPWHIPHDLQHFKKLTKNHIVIMGRKTFESMNCKPLPDRINIVISSTLQPTSDYFVFSTLANAIAYCKSAFASNMFIIGGSKLFEEAMIYADRMYLTMIDNYVEGDVRFPAVNWRMWSKKSESVLYTCTDNDRTLRYKFKVFHRKR